MRFLDHLIGPHRSERPALPGAGPQGQIVVPSSIFFVVTDAGLRGDAKQVTDGAMASGSNVFTSATGGFVLADIGKSISVEGAAAAAATLNTTIAGFTDPNTVTLAAPNASGGAVAGKQAVWGTDNTAAMAALVTTVAAANGGTIYFPPGRYLFTGSIDLSLKANITLQGAALSGTTQFMIGQGPPSRIIHTGTGGNAVISLNDAFGHCVRNLWLSYSSANYNGPYLRSNNTGPRDPQFHIIERNLFYSGLSTRNSAAWMSLDKANQIKVLDNSFEGGSNAISLRSAAGYANNILIERNMFARLSQQAITSGGLNVNIIGNTFENTAGGLGLAVSNFGTTTPAQGWLIAGNWFGDATVAGGTWLNLWGQGISIQGNTLVGMGTGSANFAIGLNTVKGFAICGNRFDSFTTAIDYSSAGNQGGLVSGNAYHSVTNFEGTTGNKDASVINTGNISF